MWRLAVQCLFKKGHFFFLPVFPHRTFFIQSELGGRGCNHYQRHLAINWMPALCNFIWKMNVISSKATLEISYKIFSGDLVWVGGVCCHGGSLNCEVVGETPLLLWYCTDTQHQSQQSIVANFLSCTSNKGIETPTQYCRLRDILSTPPLSSSC